jgi:hypothetical protein
MKHGSTHTHTHTHTHTLTCNVYSSNIQIVKNYFEGLEKKCALIGEREDHICYDHVVEHHSGKRRGH